MQLFTEAKVLEAIKHPYIIHLQDFYKTHSEKLVLILDYADGGDLKDRITAQKGQFFSEDLTTR